MCVHVDAGISDASKVRQANRRLHRRLELARQAQQNLLDDHLAGLDRCVMRKRELPSVLSPNYDDAVQQMAHSEISLALKCLREVAMRACAICALPKASRTKLSASTTSSRSSR